MSLIEGKKARKGRLTAPELSIVIPTYNERGNIAALVDAVRSALGDVPWEMIIVDDDSPDQTFSEVSRLAREEPRLRCLRRVGRRGLSSAVIEGAMVANGGAIAVMDADFQHDERILRTMYDKLIGSNADIVVATRYAEGGGIGEWDAKRAKMSDFATRMAGMLVGNQTSDPMSGFFMVRRDVFSGVIYDLSQQGYKILLDIISSSPVPLKIEEVPYTFRTRQEGESKISVMVLAQFLFLIIEKLTHGLVPPRFALFSIVGGFGLLVHLLILNALKLAGFDFLAAQLTATGVAMISNFVMNNEFTYRDRRLTGLSFIAGLVLFCLVCSFGALANVGVAQIAIHQFGNWSLAGLAGAIMGAVFNFSAATSLVWRRPRKRIFAAAG
ncbi:glycosyltransferase family 2 protein [Sphingomonadaceae bacterium G21617-S1]|jgi:dolichol-phosphate mannosyltransferase|uniref:glycosyltransferase n=1 Tax=Rhizorhabdus sp. TaxID=1968843 RepID=UPI0012142E92|nr:glycosyltransferase family 2 protein [Rhizorhabdus sp.]MBD3761040.1 glycosyltransferase family 2 protein [Rhizorhabdus sp.]MCZ4341220.1 glycosyltransferase family 2 protein [Sphingomonadaceae bacterium G21617-S1]TAK08094.1 MAG: glycosyltransferase family 2 protein [Rhizorhabdus sp.]